MHLPRWLYESGPRPFRETRGAHADNPHPSFLELPWSLTFLSFDPVSNSRRFSSLYWVAPGKWYFLDLCIFPGKVFFSFTTDEQTTCECWLFIYLLTFFTVLWGKFSLPILSFPDTSMPTCVFTGSRVIKTSGIRPGWLFSQCLQAWNAKGICHGLRPSLWSAFHVSSLTNGEAALMCWGRCACR